MIECRDTKSLQSNDLDIVMERIASITDPHSYDSTAVKTDGACSKRRAPGHRIFCHMVLDIPAEIVWMPQASRLHHAKRQHLQASAKGTTSVNLFGNSCLDVGALVVILTSSSP